jgi:hypothetical protein
VAAGRAISKPARRRIGASWKKVSSTGSQLNQGRAIRRPYPGRGIRAVLSCEWLIVGPARRLLMATLATDPEHYRRRQRRRALIGWIGGLGVIAAVVLVVVLAGGGGSHQPRPFKVPYGETMTAKQYT